MRKLLDNDSWYLSVLLLIILSMIVAFIYSIYKDLSRDDGKLLISITGLISALIFVVVDYIRKKFY